ncbi:hypothetical protein Syun_025387 [Stephania yunnanensis]|uniref:Protein kinase domain-containing protein n=1 Tax=Stephania yunnanensis TaxID=152371 RepID=A0AAP0EWX9_9MAGN
MLDCSTTPLHQCLTVPLLHYPVFTLTGHDQCSIRGEVWGKKRSSRNSPAIALVFIFHYCKESGSVTRFEVIASPSGLTNPRISDFGIARIFGSDQTQGNTNKVVGTYGYMSPEYAMDGLFSIKSDIFSFGVLLLEIISGKKNSGFYHKDPSMNLIKHSLCSKHVNEIIGTVEIRPSIFHPLLTRIKLGKSWQAWELWKEGRPMELLDPSMGEFIS